MHRDQAIATLQAHEQALRDRGVLHAALFGSVARGEMGRDSDLDIMIDIDPDAQIGVWGYAGIRDYIAALFPGHVDVASRNSLKTPVRVNAERDAVYAF
jgi:predicted nucleotidyltransferase